MIAFYFGCWSPDKTGHFLYNSHGQKIREDIKDFPMRPTALDGSLLNGVPDKQGNAVLFHGRGWTLLSFWDRSGDSRPASNSTFVFHDELTFESAVEEAQLAFPGRWSRIKFAVTEYESGVAR